METRCTGTHRFLTLSTKTLATRRAGDLQLVSIIDKPRGALRKTCSLFTFHPLDQTLLICICWLDKKKTLLDTF